MVEFGAGDPASGRIDGEPGIVERYGSVRAREQRNCLLSSPSADPRSPRACSARRPDRDPDVLIRLLYGAAMQPERWPETLDAIGDALGGAVLVASHRRIGGPVLAVTHRLDPSAEGVLRARYSQVDSNPLMGAMRRLPVLSPVWRDAVMPEKDYLSSGLFQDVFRQQGLQHAAISCLAREGRLLIASGVLRRNSAAFDAHHLRLYQHLLPHLRQALEIAARFSDLSLQRDHACMVADATEWGSSWSTGLGRSSSATRWQSGSFVTRTACGSGTESSARSIPVRRANSCG